MSLRGSPEKLSPIIPRLRHLNSAHHVAFPRPLPYIPHFLLLPPGVTSRAPAPKALSQALIWGKRN